MANEIKSKDQNAAFTEKYYVAIMILEDQKEGHLGGSVH